MPINAKPRCRRRRARNRSSVRPSRPADLLPAERGFLRYQGSLTTPPCSKGVRWTAFTAPIEASPAQVRQFAELFPANARAVMSLNQRFLLESL